MRNTILIVDDMEINRAILAEGFSDVYEIVEASNGKEALEIINSNNNIKNTPAPRMSKPLSNLFPLIKVK